MRGCRKPSIGGDGKSEGKTSASSRGGREGKASGISCFVLDKCEEREAPRLLSGHPRVACRRGNGPAGDVSPFFPAGGSAGGVPCRLMPLQSPADTVFQRRVPSLHDRLRVSALAPSSRLSMPLQYANAITPAASYTYLTLF